MNKPNIDDLFKDKLAERDFPFDESAWEAAADLLDQALPVKQQKRPLYKWMIVSLILFIGLGVTLYQVNSSRPVAETAEPNTHNSDARATHENEKKDNSSSSTPNAIQSSTNNNHSQANPPASNKLKNTPTQTPSFTTDKAPNTASNATSNTASNAASNTTSNTTSNAVSTAKPSKGSATSIVASTKSTSTASSSPVSPASPKGPTNSKVNQTDNQPATPNSVQTPVVPPVSGTSSLASASPAPQQNSANASSNNNPVATTSGVDQVPNAPQTTTANQAANTTAVAQSAENTVPPAVTELRSTQLLDAIALNALQSPGIVSNDRPEEPKLKSETQPILKRAKTLSYSVAVQAGAMYNMHQLASSTTEQTNFINQRKASEAATVTPSLGILASMHYKRWSLSTGINMGSWATSTNYNGTFLKDTSYHNVSVVDTTYLQRRYVYSIQTQQVLDSFFVQIHSTYQDTSLVVTQVDYSVSDASKLKQTMRSAYIELPLLLGYQFRFGRFGVGLQTGPAIGLIYKQQGYVLNEDLLGVGLLSASPLSSRKVQFNYLAAAQAEYQISPKISILLQGVYRQSLGSLHSDYTQRYRQFGLQAGLKYKF